MTKNYEQLSKPKHKAELKSAYEYHASGYLNIFTKQWEKVDNLLIAQRRKIVLLLFGSVFEVKKKILLTVLFYRDMFVQVWDHLMVFNSDI